MSIINKYPYTDFHEMNLDYVLAMVMRLDSSMDEFKVLNSIRFEGVWNIERAYQAWSLVDTPDHNGYIAIKPVPIGVNITNEDYWRQVANYSELYADIQNRIIALENEVGTISKKLVFVTPETYGAAGDGITDDTKPLQDALDSGYPVFLENKYLVTASDISPWHHGLIIHDDTYLFGHGSLILNKNNYANYDILLLDSVNNVTIRDITIIGDRNLHEGTSGEWGFGVNISNSENITIDNVKVSDCWGDGIYIANYDTTFIGMNKNIKVVNSTITNCRRNNISIENGQNIVIDSCLITDANGTSPESGVDIEPNSGEIVDFCSIINCTFRNNNRLAIDVNDLVNARSTNIFIDSNTIEHTNAEIAAIGLTGGTHNSKNIVISNNTITAPIALSSLYALVVFDNNKCYLSGSTTSPAFHFEGNGNVISNNYIECSTTYENMIELRGIFNRFINNLVYGSAQGLIIQCDASCAHCTIDGNTFACNTNGAIIGVVNTNKLTISHNILNYSVLTPYFLQALSGYASSGESISFNDVRVSSRLTTGGAFINNYNLVNGSTPS